MNIGTWNLEVYPSRQSLRGVALAAELDRHSVDVWLLTELHLDWEVAGHDLCFAPPRKGTLEKRRSAATSSSWDMVPIHAPGDQAEGWMCLARLKNPDTNDTCLAVSTVLPWRGITPYWREILNRQMSYAEVFRHVLDYIVQRIKDERRPDENVIWGGDFNQALSGRDYVGTNQGRADLQNALDRLGLQAATSNLPAAIPTHPAIDHIAIPLGWTIEGDPTVRRPIWNGKPLSDHALYVISAHPKAKSL